MFEKNIGTLDRTLRIIIGVALLAGFFLNPEASARWLYLIGVVPLLTAAKGSCLLYSIFGIRTCPAPRPDAE